jgi:predicted RNA-binding Zn-ribbon protein involved in translation (DUF1610 family)
VTQVETPKIPVYFACHDCGRVYLTSQQRSRNPGHFDCNDCGVTVHMWSGHYAFTDWKRV